MAKPPHCGSLPALGYQRLCSSHCDTAPRSGHVTVQGKASQAYNSAAQGVHEATREPTTFEKAKGYFTPSTTDKVKGHANQAYADAKVCCCIIALPFMLWDHAEESQPLAQQAPADVAHDKWCMLDALGPDVLGSSCHGVHLSCALQGKASDAYDSAAQTAHDATREPTTFEKAKGYLSPPSAADKAKGHANQAYNTAKARRLAADSAHKPGIRQAAAAGSVSPASACVNPLLLVPICSLHACPGAPDLLSCVSQLAKPLTSLLSTGQGLRCL